MVVVAIVNYRTADVTLRAVDAAIGALESYPSAKVLVVENDSGDGSLETLQAGVAAEGWGSMVTVLAAPKNGGFGYGCNLAIRHAQSWEEPPRFVYLLNPDAFPEKNTIRALVEFLETHPSAGIAGSAFLEGEPTELLEAALRFPSIGGEFVDPLRLGPVHRLFPTWSVRAKSVGGPQLVDWVLGASMMVRQEVFEEIGLFDEDFFLMYEEIDLCRRAAEAGWPSWLVPESRLPHIGGLSTGTRRTEWPRPEYWFESRRRYFLKTGGRLYLGAANVAWLLGQVGYHVHQKLRRRPINDPPRLIRDFIRYNYLRFVPPRH